MPKYPVIFSKGGDTLKRSLTPDQLEVIFLLCSGITVNANKRTTGEITFKIFTGEFYQVLIVKRVPFYLIKRFVPEKQWKQRIKKQRV